MLLNMGQEVRLLDIESGETLRKYVIPSTDGNPNFIIRSRFGGVGEHFVTSGSEGMLRNRVLDIQGVESNSLCITDSKIFIWDKGNGTLIRTMQAHESGCVNTIAWSPTNAALFASVGDDRKLRM